MIKRIHFVATWFDPMLGQRTELSDFTLGIGPCGKEVVALDYEWSGERNDLLTIVQVHSDNTSKVFYYRASDIRGRVDCEYDEPN